MVLVRLFRVNVDIGGSRMFAINEVIFNWYGAQIDITSFRISIIQLFRGIAELVFFFLGQFMSLNL